MLVVGLTGGIGCGKSAVAGGLAAKGAVVIDADDVVREVQRPGGPAYGGIVERFGPAVVAADGTLDRPALAAVAFSDARARADLGALTHPHVRRFVLERLSEMSGTDTVVVLVVPLLAETGRGTYPVAGVIVVDCPPEVAVRRLVEFRGMSEEAARARAAAQASRPERLAIADLVLDNGAGLSALEAEIDRAWAWIREGALAPPPSSGS